MPVRYTAEELVRLIKKDGWVLDRSSGAHHQYVHPTKKGLTTISMHKGTMNPKTAKSILKQAGLK
jgi:predicted RNA binding protein YcfA (HicA-like mRNA interferase family)